MHQYLLCLTRTFVRSVPVLSCSVLMVQVCVSVRGPLGLLPVFVSFLVFCKSPCACLLLLERLRGLVRMLVGTV